MDILAAIFSKCTPKHQDQWVNIFLFLLSGLRQQTAITSGFINPCETTACHYAWVMDHSTVTEDNKLGLLIFNSKITVDQKVKNFDILQVWTSYRQRHVSDAEALWQPCDGEIAVIDEEAEGWPSQRFLHRALKILWVWTCMRQVNWQKVVFPYFITEGLKGCSENYLLLVASHRWKDVLKITYYLIIMTRWPWNWCLCNHNEICADKCAVAW